MRVRKTLLKGPLGFGAAPLGNMFRNIPDAEASATVEAAWEQGTRFFDTEPFYGAGLSEIRLGKVLSKQNRDDYVLSTKVGRIILDEIAAELGTSENTVKTQRHQVMEKMGANSLPELVRMADKLGSLITKS